jgi:hypothetical protein
MQLGDYSSARNTFRRAYQLGFREQDFLLNYATVLGKTGWSRQSIDVYSEILASTPNESRALRGRARAQLNAALRARRQVPPEALEDAAADVALNPDSLEALCNAADLFGYAASMDPENTEYRDRGRRCLKRALELGMSRSMYEPAKSRFTALHDEEIQKLVAQAPEDRESRFDANPPGQLPQTIDWVALTRPDSR